MAFLAAGFGMSVTFLDNGSNTTSREYIMDETITTYDDAAVAAVAMIPLIEALTDAEISAYRVFNVFNEGTLVIPGVGVQIENTASLTALLTAAGNKKANLNMPAPKQAMFVASSGTQANIVNTTYAALVSWIAQFTAAGAFTISDGEEVARLLDGKRVHKKSNRG